MALLSFDGDNAYKRYAVTSVSKKFKLIPIESIKIEGGEVSQDDIHLLVSSGLFTIDICGDIYSGLGILLNTDKTLVLGDVEKYGVCILIKGGGESGKHTHTCLLDPKRYGKDLNTSYYLRVYAEVSDLDVTNDYRFLVDKKRALEYIEYGEDAALFPTEPYIEETYDADGNLIGAKLYGHTKIRYQAFQGCTNLAHISLPESLMSIGSNAFNSCTNLALTSLPEGLTRIDASAFYGCTNLALTSLPESLKSIGNSAFVACTNLALTSLPEFVTSIGNKAFQGCTNLALTSLPTGVTSIDEYAFQGCTSLTSITFKGTPTSIKSNVFSGCTNLTDIKVPWAEGAVANAPWGATNATITYNYTGA